MPQGEHSAILLTFIKLPFVIYICVLSIFEWPFKTGFTVHVCDKQIITQGLSHTVLIIIRLQHQTLAKALVLIMGFRVDTSEDNQNSV